MSQLVDLFNSSQKPRVAEARQIPKEETDFFDREHKIADGFTTGLKKGDPTQFKEAGLNEYDSQVASITPPPSYDPKTPLHRFTPKTPFYNPGQPKA